ncbi:MAG: phosphotransferase [Chloroflexota bacterium]
MNTSVLEPIANLLLPHMIATRLNLPLGTLSLRRAWPRAVDHLLLEYMATDGAIVPGQWFLDQTDAEQTVADLQHRAPAKDVALIECMPGSPSSGYVVLQRYGADSKLVGLAPLLASSGTQLLVHRPERRAVVRLETPEGLRFAKIVPPKRLPKVLSTGYMAAAVGRQTFDTPSILQSDQHTGTVIWSALSGTMLYDSLNDPSLESSMIAIGEALGGLHGSTKPLELNTYTAESEIAMLETWIARLTTFMPDLGDRCAVLAPSVYAALAESSNDYVPIHRDFYDKQVFLSANGRVGLLDFDTFAYGEAALDIANMLVHFELRVLQGYLQREQAERAVAAFLACYAPSPAVQERIDAYIAATRLRLACVYAFRPHGRVQPSALLALLHNNLSVA